MPTIRHADRNNAEELQELQLLWEASVRASHDFLPEQMIVSLRPYVLDAFEHIETLLVLTKNDAQSNELLGFIGLQEQKIEMLFIHPHVFGQGHGQKLLTHGIQAYGAQEVDVNEQNPKAVRFYQHMGFSLVKRSPLDGQSNPYPILHLRLEQTA